MASFRRSLSSVAWLLGVAAARAEPLGLRLAPGMEARIDSARAGGSAWTAVPPWSAILPWAAAVCALAALYAFDRSRASLAAALRDSERRCRDLLHGTAGASLDVEAPDAAALMGAPLSAIDGDRGSSDRAKSDFLASMSHEIRTPLTALIGFADLILSEPGLPASVRRNAERIRGGGDALLAIVSDTLEYAQAEAGALRLTNHPFSLPLVVDECVALVERAAVEKRLALHVELGEAMPPEVLGDAARLRQILLSLLNNAVKFTHAGEIRLTIGLAPGTPHRVLFEVSDTGIGIAASDLPRLFERFSQVDGSLRRPFGGSGLGLAISKALVELMGGEIGVRSEKGVGSTFWFTSELAPAPPAAAPILVSGPTAPSPRGLDVLVVEDTPINQELARAVVEMDGHRVDVVCDGAEAIMAVADKNYDLVLMDVQMPHVDGLAATRAIRRLAGHCRFVPIVAMTANVLKTQDEAARAAGMDDVLAKPLDFAALRAVLAKAGRGEAGAVASDEELDDATLAELARILGTAKVAGMLRSLADTLAARFTALPEGDGVGALRAEAHASIPGAAMLGLKPFSRLCRQLADATEPSQAAAVHGALAMRLGRVVATARRAADTLSVPAQRLVA